MESVYIHIPFCKSICSYCDFCKVLYNGPWITPYLNALIKEIQDKYEGEEIKTIYIGGGTPSSLTLKDIKYLLSALKIFNTDKLEEFTFECNLNDINTYLLQLLKDYNVNRLSIGIESFNENKLSFMERSHTFEEAKEKINMARELGFDNINVDLIYGIPGETIKDLKKDIELLLELKPDHISTYSLIIEDNTKIGISNMVPISEDLDAEMYNLVCKKLENYNHYEVSNFAKEGKESKHNLAYWNNNEYYGFGLGASGYVHGARYENTKSLTKYINGTSLYKQEILSQYDQMYNEIMLGLRKLEGINCKKFYQKYNTNVQDVFNIKEAIKENELIYEDDYLYINPDYIYVMNEILIKIL